MMRSSSSMPELIGAVGSGPASSSIAPEMCEFFRVPPRSDMAKSSASVRSICAGASLS